MGGAELAITAFDFVTREMGPTMLIIAAISVADLIIWFIIRLFKKLPFQPPKIKW